MCMCFKYMKARKDNLSNLVKILKKPIVMGLGIICIVLLGRLIISIINSGYHYIFDFDELHHSQIIYLLNHGYKPFTQIYLTVYPPIFHWLLSPLFMLQGYSFDTIYLARIVMIVLFFFRVGLVTILLYLLFDKKTALLFIPLMLFSPFAIFAEMQIRPDNFMVTVFILGVTLTAYALKIKRRLFYFLGSFVTLFALLILMKSLPGVIAYFVIISIYLLIKRDAKTLFFVILGGASAVVVYSLPFLLTGTFQEMIQQVFVESLASYSGVFEYPISLGFFYQSKNPALYGIGGKPITWIYTWLLPPLAFAGAYQILIRIVQTPKTFGWKIPILLIAIASFLGQWSFLFFVESVFIQHYIAVNWLFAFFAAITLGTFLQTVQKNPFLFYPTILTLVAFFLLLTKTSIMANEFRATQDSAERIRYYRMVWSLIPENEPVFPNQLFRPLAYPVPHGHYIGNVPAAILKRLPRISDSLEKNKTKYVYIDGYYFVRIPHEAQEYITSHYTKSPLDEMLYIRN